MKPRFVGSRQHKRTLHVMSPDFRARLETALKHSKKVILAFAKSKSHPTGKPHEIRLAADHSIYCTCQGWQFNKDIPKTCPHIRRYIDRVVPQEI